jgi:hypothetical protein
MTTCERGALGVIQGWRTLPARGPPPLPVPFSNTPLPREAVPFANSAEQGGTGLLILYAGF